MSRSNPTAKNPAQRFMQWKGGEEGGGQVTFWDKEEEVEKVVGLPFSFLVLDELNTITGFSEADHGGFWSNEVRNLMTDELVVKTNSGLKARGLYGEISDSIKAKGAKYAKSVYVAFKDESGELLIGNIKISGAALTSWIEFQKKFDVYKCAVVISGGKKAKKGSNTYFTPVFEGREVAETTQNAANQLDAELQTYLENYMSRKPEVGSAVAEDDNELVPTTTKEVVIEDLDVAQATPATETKAATKPAAKAATTAPTDPNEIPLNDVPF